jgi:proline iminopeptidase
MMASIPEYNAYAQEVLAPQWIHKSLEELQKWRKRF